MRRSLISIAIVFGVAAPLAASAEFSTVTDQKTFVALIQGKELRRPFVKLEVTPDGTISGRGAAWSVSGDWTWNDGYFCRNLFWDGDALGYNCQMVQARGDRIKFTSDKGAGDSAEFRLR